MSDKAELNPLPFDTARCIGIDSDLCQICRRREPGHPTRQTFINPMINDWGCPGYIDRDELTRAEQEKV